MEDKYDKESNEEYAFFKEEPITDYDLDTLFLEHDKTKVSEKARKEFIEKNRIAKAKIRDGLTGDDEVAATNWKGFPTPTKGAIKRRKLIPKTSPMYTKLNFEGPAIKFTNRLTVPPNTPITPRFQMYEKEWKDGAWRLLPKDRQEDLQYMAAKGGPAVMGIPVRYKKGTKRKRSGGRRKKRKKKTRKKRGGDKWESARKQEKKKYCKKYYKGKYGINKKGCKKDPMCKYVDMGSGGEWCYTKKRKYKKKKRKTRRKKRKTRKR